MLTRKILTTFVLASLAFIAVWAAGGCGSDIGGPGVPIGFDVIISAEDTIIEAGDITMVRAIVLQDGSPLHGATVDLYTFPTNTGGREVGYVDMETVVTDTNFAGSIRQEATFYTTGSGETTIRAIGHSLAGTPVDTAELNFPSVPSLYYLAFTVTEDTLHVLNEQSVISCYLSDAPSQEEFNLVGNKQIYFSSYILGEAIPSAGDFYPGTSATTSSTDYADGLYGSQPYYFTAYYPDLEPTDVKAAVLCADYRNALDSLAIRDSVVVYIVGNGL